MPRDVDRESVGQTMQQSTIFVEPTPPYDFDLIACYAARFRGVYGADRPWGQRRLRGIREDGRLTAAT